MTLGSFQTFPYQLFGFLRFARDRNVKSANKYECSDVFGLDIHALNNN